MTHGLGNIKLKIKWPGRVEKNTNLVENVKKKLISGITPIHHTDTLVLLLIFI